MIKSKLETIVLIVVLSIAVTTKSLGCFCDLKPEFHSPVDLLEYEFISLVRIAKIDSVLNSKEYSEYSIHKIQFEILELFKGANINNVLAEGGHRSIKNSWTSCDMGENIGDEWIIFAYLDKRNKQLVTGSCTRSFRRTDSDGYRYKGYGQETTTIDKLRVMFNKKVVKENYEGKHIEYYSNGQKELEENYQKNKLEGERLLWYPNGIMESKQYFTKGLKNGTSMWYSKKGQLVKEEKFINDKNVDITTYWHEIDTSKINLLLYSKFFSVTMDSARKINSKLTISATRFYNKKGELLRFNSFDQRGFKKNETIYFPKENREIHRYFHDNGMTSAEWNRVDNKDFGQYREWDKNGDLIKTWDYDKNGLQIKESIKIGKDLNRP